MVKAKKSAVESSDEEDCPLRAPFKEISMNKNTAPEATIEETYQKKTQIEHILLRPDT